MLDSKNIDAEGIIESVDDLKSVLPKSNITLRELLTEASQAHLEMIYSKHQLLDVIRQEFVDADLDGMFIEHGIPVAFGYDFLTQMYLHKRALPNVMVSILRRHFETEEDPAQACADMIWKAVEADLADWIASEERLVTRWEIPPEVQERLDVLQYPLPMIQKPAQVTHNREVGYYTITSSVILKKSHTDDDVCLDHLNRSNSIPLSLNEDVVQFVRNKWRHLDKKKEDESWPEFRQRQKAFEKYDRTSRDVIAALLLQGNRFWLTHRYDFRGRTYSQGYHVNPQGNDWNKACVQLAEDFAEPLNDA